MLIDINYVQTVPVHHAMWNACVETQQQCQIMTSLAAIHIHRLTLSSLPILLNPWGNNLGD